MQVEEILVEALKSGVLVYVEQGELAFEVKKGEFPDRIRHQLKENKQAVIQYLIDSQLEDNNIFDGDIVLTPRSLSNDLPLSYAQQRLWFVSQLEGGNAAYNIPAALRLTGELSITALERALQTIIARHESLRTTFKVKDGQPHQHIADKVEFSLNIQDIRALTASKKQRFIIDKSEKEMTTPFSLEIGPLIRASLLTLKDNEYVLLLTMHHLVSDGWSMQVLIHEVNTLYQAFQAGEENPLVPLAIQYADYSEWQRQWLTPEAIETHENYWLTQLESAPPLLTLPTDYARPAIQGYQGDSVAITVNQTLRQRLKRLASSHGLTLHMVLYAAWVCLLARLSGQHEIVVGTPVANRQRSELEPMIGLFLNTLALKTDVNGYQSIKQLLEKVKQLTVDAYAHQDIPFEHIVDKVQAEKGLSHSPVFQVLFDLHEKTDNNVLESNDLQVEFLDTKVEVAKFDLTLSLSDQDDGITGTLGYSVDLFHQQTIQRWSEYLLSILNAFVDNIEQPVQAIELLSDHERTELLIDFNNTRDTQTSFLVHEWFEQQVVKTPDAIAVIDPVQECSFEALNSRANQVAHELIHRGVTTDTLVGIYTQRSLDMLVAILGTLKAGAAYVPLEPGYPTERLSYVMGDARIDIVLTQRELLKDACLAPQHLLTIDDTSIKKRSKQNPNRSAIGVNCLAYVIYTSGSTGKPKGVEVMHSGVSNYLSHVTQNYLPQVSGAVVNTPLSFDATVTSLLTPLVVGKRVYLLEKSSQDKEIAALKKQLMSSTDNLLFKITPAHLQALQMDIEQDQPLSLLAHQFVIGGEQLSTAVLKKWKNKVVPNGIFINEYGPTETVVGCCTYTVNDQVSIDSASVPIGRPIVNTQLYVVDSSLQPVPRGVVGELLIGGAGVARGYLGKKELTSERFISNPFSNDGQSRLYRTGDLVRYANNDQLEFIGRVDHQVKLRGFRIELGEIESQLAMHPSINEAAVLLQEKKPNHAYLIAYVSYVDNVESNNELLREQLQSQLPDYMIPSDFVTLASLPLTANDKIDRHALAQLSYIPADTHAEYQAPQTDTEKVIAGIWCDILNLEIVGRCDNFYKLGGHSLLAIRLAAHLQRDCHVDISIPDLFQHPELKTLAAFIDTSLSPSKMGDSIPIADRTKPLVLSPSQQRLWFITQLEGNHATYNIPAALHLQGKLNIDALEKALTTIVARHDILRTVIKAEGEHVWQEVKTANAYQIAYTDLAHLNATEQKAEIHHLAQKEANTEFDLGIGPLFRVSLLGLATNEHTLLITMHHIISDAWSMNIMVQEMNLLYQSYCVKQDITLEPLPIQYADYAAWQQTVLTQETIQHQENYWKTHLRNAPGLLTLPTDYSRPAAQSYRGDQIDISIGTELSNRLNELATSEDITLHTVLYSAWTIVLSKLSGQDHIVVGTPVANRQRYELENIIGFFINTLPLCVDLSDELTLKNLFDRVKKISVDSYAHQDLAFERIVEITQPERSMAQSPLFQVLFDLSHDSNANKLELAGLQLEEINNHTAIAKYDLTLSLTNGADGLVGNLGYATDLFRADTIERWISYFITTLEAMVNTPDISIRTLSIIPEQERQALLTHEQHGKKIASAKTIPQLFEQQVEESPRSIAVIEGDKQLSFLELNNRANQVAHELMSRGVQPGVFVGIYMQRSTEMLIAILAIMKAGGAYIPLEPSYPASRLRYMLDDANPLMVLTCTEFLSKVDIVLPQTLCLDDQTLWDTVKAHPKNTIKQNVSRLTETDSAYVIYTSGSTGKPKGVDVTHAGVINYVMHAIHEYLPSLNGSVVNTVLSFDATITSLLSPLMAGKKVHLIAQREHDEEIRAIHQLLLSTTEPLLFKLTPAHLQALVLMNDKSIISRQAHYFVIGGEQLSTSLVMDYQSCLPNALFINEYGPTETVVGCSTYTVNVSANNTDSPSVPIGKPIINTQLYVVDQYLRLSPYGAIGELLIGGEGVANGYINRRELTSDKFITHPFSEDPSERVYRTGDLVRYVADGQLEFIGRLDNQIKLRGYRIELGEIEAELMALDSVNNAAVLLNQDSDQLIAYICVDQDKPAGIDDISTQLNQQLPEYMVPAQFVLLDTLALTSNGKIDRSALRVLQSNPSTDLAYVAPQSETERTVADIWKEILTIDKVGRDDNFYHLGGHSLQAIRLAAQVQQRLGRELSIRTLFEYPVLKDLAQALDKACFVTLDAIQPIKRIPELPTSWAQQRLWFISQFEEANAAYHIPMGVRLQGKLVINALQEALNTIIARHEILRTVFIEKNGEPKQVIKPIAAFDVEYKDLSELDPASQQSTLIAESEEEASKTFDLEQGPLIRGRLLTLANDEHVLFITMHHIISDGRSIDILIHEFSHLYTAFQANKSNPLVALNIQYADYASWQRQWLTDDVLQQQEKYWLEHLSDAPTMLELPLDYPRPLVQTHRGNRVDITMDKTVCKRLKALAKAEGLTPHMVLFAAWAITLSRLSGQQHVVIGTPIANRQRNELDGLIGFFVNTLALQADLSGSPTIKELLQRIKDISLAGYAHQEVPFERVVDLLQPNRSMNHSPIFQTVFNFDQDTKTRDIELPNLQLSSVATDTLASHFDLTLMLVDHAEGISGSLEYATDLFDHTTIKRWSTYFSSVVHQLVLDTSMPVEHITLLSKAERDYQWLDCNPALATTPTGNIHNTFETVVSATPTAIAVIDGEYTLSYQQLNARANQLAHHLIKNGLKREMLVGLCIPRSADMCIAILAILKAGGAYVPLDPLYPLERLQYQIKDTSLCCILTLDVFNDHPAFSATKTICVDNQALKKQLMTYSDQSPVGVNGQQNDLAYVIYTSGSTGIPKGVMTEHNSVVSLVINNHYVPLSSETIMLHNAPITFDAATFELWGALLNGGQVVIQPQALIDINTLATFINQQDINTAWMTSGLFDQFAASYTEPLPTLDYLLVGGDVVNVRSIQRIRENNPDLHLINGYGPTENTTFSCSYLIPEQIELEQSLPLGKPLAYQKAYILDKHLTLLPLGCIGELHLTGSGLARGYINQPELSADKFIENPFYQSGDPGNTRRLYKTGDLVRWNADGDIIFIGRVDNQIKLRGFRIELGDIQTQVCQHPAVEDAVLLLDTKTIEDSRLVAYVSLRDNSELCAQTLRSFLKTRLPEYMIPSVVMTVDSIPLTTNGKVDRKALPAVDIQQLQQVDFQEPLGEIEIALAQLWASLLGIDAIGRADNFFDLGGHSLLAIRLIALIQHELGKEISISTLFANPVLADLAQALRQSENSVVQTIPIADRSQPLALSWSQQRLWFIAQLEGANAAYNMPMALRLQGALSAKLIEKIMNTIIERHEILRTVIRDIDGHATQVIYPSLHFTLMYQDISDSDQKNDIVNAESEHEATTPFDLENGPLLRGRLLKLAEKEHVLLITLHHIVSDAWSMELLTQEVSALYQAYSTGKENPLVPLHRQYADYAQWQRDYLQQEKIAQREAYWTEHLFDAPALLNLPLDHERPVIQRYRGDQVAIHFDQETSERITTFTASQGLTLHMFFFTAWAILLSRLSNEKQVVIGTPVANRSHPELDPLIGFFVNTLALKADLRDNPDISTMLARVKQLTLDSYAYQDVPLERIVELVQPERSMSHAPLFQTLFSLNEVSNHQNLTLDGLQLEIMEVESLIAQFDVSLSLNHSTQGISGCVEYATDLFEHATIKRWLGYFKNIVDALMSSSDQSIDHIQLLSAQEQSTLITGFIHAEPLDVELPFIHQQFEAVVQAQPHAIAAIHGEQKLSYIDLNQRANKLARYLRDQGIQTGEYVGIYLPRSLDFLVSLLAVLKAGAAYIVIDPANTIARSTHIMETAELTTIISQSSLAKDAFSDCICLDANTTQQQISTHKDTNLHITLDEAAAAFAYFTSGSTGIPKGALNSHAGVVNNMLAMSRELELSPRDRVLQFASLGFDVVIEEVFPAWFAGASVVLRDEEGLLTAEQFQQLLTRNQISVCELMADYWSHWLQYLRQQKMTPVNSLRIVMLGSKVSMRDYEQWQIFDIALATVFGLTETACTSLIYHAKGPQPYPHYLPNGRALANTQVYILDEAGAIVPQGVIGELYIGGIGVGLGYLNSAALTAEHFINNPFAKGQLYKTGDRVRWLADGNLDFIGRNDHQIKIRGFRIELGEIEYQLRQLETIKEAAVVVDQRQHDRIIAWVTPLDNENIDITNTTDYLQTVLPDYMQPSAIIALDSMSMTLSGKINYQALPEADIQSLQTSYEPPQTKTESIIADSWQTLLKVESVGRKDNFFMLGGHSLLVIQFIAQLQALNIKVDVRDVFETANVQALALKVDSHTTIDFTAPPNIIPQDCKKITPALLPLLDLGQEHIELIASLIPGGMANIQDIYPLAPLQEGILFHHMLGSPETGDTYVMPTILTADNQQQVERFIEALQKVVARHDILRTAVLWEDLPIPVQVVLRQADIVINKFELDATKDSLTQLHTRIEPANLWIDLNQAPLFCIDIAVDPQSEKYFIVIKEHHMINDHIGLEILLEELNVYLDNREEPLPAPVQYREFVAHTVAMAKNKDIEAYFHSRFSDMDEPTLPFGLRDIQADASDIQGFTLTLEPELAESIRLQSQQLGISPASFFHLAWALVVGRASRRDDVVFGTTLSGRLQGTQGVAKMLGLFINTLPIRLSLRASAKDSLLQTHQELLSLLNHEQASFALVRSCTALENSAPLFTNLLNYRYSEQEAKTAGSDNTLQVLEAHERTNYPLSIAVDDISGKGFDVTVHALSSLNSGSMTVYVKTALENLLQALEADSVNPVSTLEILPTEEKTQLVVNNNKTDVTYADDQLVQMQFEAMVAAHPQAIALTDGDTEVSYQTLNARANQVAYELRQLGVKPDTYVGLYMRRSIDMLIAILGILKAGGAYLPLEPDYPDERIAYLIKDAAVDIILSQHDVLKHSDIKCTHLICVDDKHIKQHPALNPDYQAMGLTPDNLIYAIYTSGSTGTPKGVEIMHSGVINYLAYCEQYFMDDVAGTVMSTAISFDATVTSLFPALMMGKKVHLIKSTSQEGDIEVLKELLLTSQEALTFKVTPAHLQAIQIGWRENKMVSELRHIFVIGGEPLHTSVISQWTDTFIPNGIFFNEYGPTETVVGCTIQALNDNQYIDHDVVPIGKPIMNTQLYVVDAQLQLVPKGAVGELLIGGAGVARGYSQRAELTAEKFIANPFSNDSNSRVYRSGDLVRYLADDSLEFIGRIDHQVKIRGFRIELGEIEALLSAHVLISHAAVVIVDERLIAYTVAQDGSTIDVDQVFNDLQSSLPSYMLPAAILCIEALPLTSNGKIDRKALVLMEGEQESRDYEAPIGDTEKILATMWQEFFEVEKVGRSDNFFELGGHSLVMLQALNRIKVEFGVQVPLDIFYKISNLAEAAKIIDMYGYQLAAQTAIDDKTDDIEEGII